MKFKTLHIIRIVLSNESIQKRDTINAFRYLSVNRSESFELTLFNFAGVQP